MFAAKDLFFDSNTGGYRISRSVRLRSSASAYFQRTPAASGNRQTYTWSGWVKRGLVAAGTYYALFTAGQVTGGDDGLFFDTTAGALYFTPDQSATSTLISSSVYRDPSAWYHIVLAVDTTQATSTNRIKIYVNGVQLTSFSTATYPAQNLNSTFINTANIHRIGAHTNAGFYFDGYMTEVNFIDGQQLTPSSFGATSTTTGVWGPTAYTGTYGTNGFYLNFSDNSNNTATTIGKDYSGNGNNWTPNNISVTAGVTYDSMVDTPTPYGSDSGAGGEVRGNYAVLNPVAPNPSTTASTCTDGNLTASASAANTMRKATMSITSGKFYFEATIGSTTQGFGLGEAAVNSFGTNSSTAGARTYYLYNASTNLYTILPGSDTSITSPVGSGGTLAIAVDMTNKKLWLGYAASGGGSITWIGGGSPASGTTPTYTLTNETELFPLALTNGPSMYCNFGQRAFSYTAPSGFKALCTQNLSTPTIANGASYMAASLWTGNGSSQSITNTVGTASFKPDLVWTKGRSGASNHSLVDSVRGITLQLSSNLTAAEVTDATEITALNSNGFSVGNSSGAGYSTNANGTTYVGWQWLAGAGSSSSNTNGSITSTVSVNATAGFSVVTYTANNTAGATIGHGLGVAPNMIIVKSRNNVNSWNSYHSSLGNTQGIDLNSTSAASTSSNYWNNTSPTSSVFSVALYTNNSTFTYVAYCFAAIAGYSAFGSYTGNGSTDGPFIYTGFRPRWVLVKNYDLVSGENWYVIDSSRNTYNVASSGLFPNLTNAEGGTNVSEDFLSNGFKIRATGTPLNNSGGTYIYAAFAETAFKFSLGR